MKNIKIRTYKDLLILVLSNLGLGFNAKIGSIDRFKHQITKLNIFNGCDDVRIIVGPYSQYDSDSNTGEVHVVFDDVLSFAYTIKDGKVIKIE